MKPHELDTVPLREAAYAEAALFSMPSGWQEGREVRHALAIDAPYSLDVDDAISVTPQADGSHTLHVSIADVGTFVPDYPFISAYAVRTLKSVYRGHKAVIPMLPERLSEDLLSLLHDQERPAITFHLTVEEDGTVSDLETSREVLIAERMSYLQAHTVLKTGEGDALGDQLTTLTALETVARRLYVARHSKDELRDFVVETEEGDTFDASPNNRAMLIVQESMLATNIHVTRRYANELGVPWLHRNHLDPTGSLGENVPRALRSRIGRAYYSPNSRGHIGLGVDTYGHVTSPLRRIDFCNHANLVAYLEGGEPPYLVDHLSVIGRRISRLAGNDRTVSGRFGPEGASESSAVKKAATINQAAALMMKIETGTVRTRELAQVFFGELSGAEGKDEVHAVRQAAARYIADRVQLAEPVIKSAQTKGLLQTETAEESTPEDPLFLLTDRQGNVYKYPIKRFEGPRLTAAVRLLGRVAGVSVTPKLPHRLTSEGRILTRAPGYLASLALKHAARYTETTMAVKDPASPESAHRSTVTIRVGGVKKLSATAYGPGPKSALKRAAVGLIQSYDLIKNPKAALAPNKDPRMPLLNKVNDLAKELGATVTRTYDGEARIFTFVIEDNNGGRICAGTGHGSNKAEARFAAARDMLQQMGKL